MTISMYAVIPQGGALPEFGESRLTAPLKTVYSRLAVAKSIAGISTPFLCKAYRRQLFDVTGFFMRKICVHLSNSLGKLRLNYGGLDEGASARRDLASGSTNLVQFTTNQRLVPLGGDNTSSQEAVFMTTTPTQAVSTAMIYTFLIASGARSLTSFKRIRTVSLVAQSERLAREQLSGLPLVFVSRFPSKKCPENSGHQTSVTMMNNQEVAA